MRYSRCRLMITRKPDNTDYLPLSLVMFHSSDECSLILVHTGPVISSRLRDSSPAAFACRLETYTAMRTILCRDKTVNTFRHACTRDVGRIPPRHREPHRNIRSISGFLSPLHPHVSAAPRPVLFIIVVIIYEQRINGGGASSLMSLPPWHGIGNNNNTIRVFFFFFPRA